MATTYQIAAEENYDAATVGAGFTNNNYTDQAYPGYGCDRINRVINYGVAVSAQAGETNSTGHDWWSGQHSILAGATYDGTSYGNHAILVRPLDTSGTVTLNSCFSASNTVPAGTTASRSVHFFNVDSGGSGYVDGTYIMVPLIVTGTAQLAFMSCTVTGGVVGSITVPVSYKATVGDVLTVNNSHLGGTGSGFQLTVLSVDGFVAAGTERRVTEFDNSTVRNGNLFVDPASGNLWMHANSAGSGVPGRVCLTYLLRHSAAFALEISPMFPFDNTDRHMDLRGATTNYAYTLQYPNAADGSTYLVGSPLTIQATEASFDYKLPYFWFINPANINPGHSGYVQSASCFSTNNKIYQLASVNTGARNFALYRFDEPSAATAPYNTGTTGGGFTTITPWASNTGPNTNITGYTTTGSAGTRQRLWYLPANNDLVALTTAYPQDKAGGTQSDFFIDCTYVGTPDGTATFDYHHAFVTGFVDANFGPLSSSGNTAPANAAYAVMDVQEVNPYLNTTSYHYTDGNAGADYARRWFAFTVIKCGQGDTVAPLTSVLTYNASAFIVFVRYAYVPGSTPAVVAIGGLDTLPETGWDTQLPLNPDYGGGPTGNSVMNLIANSIANQTISGDYYTNGVWDALTTSFWWAGQLSNMWNVSTTFSGREKIDVFNPSPPFLRLGLGGFSPGGRPTSQGHIF